MVEVNFGIVGLGRLGKIHAKNLAKNVPGSMLVAACSIVPEELEHAKNELGVEEVYATFDEMINSPSINAVAIVSPSGFHVEQITKAMKKGLHVFTEKPLGLNVAEIESVIKVINNHPNQIFMLGFMRRYDESYQYAKRLVDDGEIGELTVIRCYGIDPSKGMESFVEFAKNNDSGGLFADMSIHDIDLVRWFTNSEIKKVWALGKNAAYPELDKLGELETGAAMMELEDRTMALLVAGRNASYGYHVETELIGTKGSVRIANIPEKNLVTILNEKGSVRPLSQDFPERFKMAFINEMKEFVSCVNEKRQPEGNANDGLQATKVADACSESWEKNELVKIK
ncbi:MAG: inositol 2-dehydrogenase [Carnobacterium sp.]|nr:inositol 2-dehydrogenase [Carnobacterium sp.]